MNGNYVIETHDLTKRYGKSDAVYRLGLTVRAGNVTGFLGRNGAGKSSTIKMLLGIIRPSSGSGFLLGSSIENASELSEARRRVAYVAEDKQTYSYMTVSEMTNFARSFYDDWDFDKERELLRKFELPIQKKVRALSKGMRTKLALVLALSRRPELLILDEPSEGLDPVSIEQLLQALVTAAADGSSVFFSSHQISEVERIADHVCIIDHGQLVADKPLEEIRQHYRRITFGFSTEPPPFDLPFGAVDSIHNDGRQFTVVARSNAEDIVAIVQSLGAASIENSPLSLRELFLSTVKEETRDALV